MSSQIVPIHRTNAESNSKDIWFNAFDYQPGQDANIRWLSRPNVDLIRAKHSSDAEKFRITFDVENFQPEQIKIYIQNRKLTISGVYEERSEGRFLQKQFERNFDIPSNADVEAMASFITENHTLVVEIPLHASAQVDHLNISNNDQRRLSFSLNKFNDSNSNSISNELSAPASQIRRTSVTKTTTTTTTGSHGLPTEATELLKSAEDTSSSSSHTYSSSTTERRSSSVGNPTPIGATTSSTKNTLTSEDLANLPIEIPPELLASGGTITIQKRKVSVTKGAGEPQREQTTTSSSLNQLAQPSSTNSNSNSSSTSERRSSKTISSSNQSRSMTLEEFLENKTWNPTLIDAGEPKKKILQMRLQMKPGTTLEQMKISVNGHDLRVEVNNKISGDTGRALNEHSYRQISLFPTCDMDQLKTELKDDGFLHIQVPMTLP